MRSRRVGAVGLGLVLGVGLAGCGGGEPAAVGSVPVTTTAVTSTAAQATTPPDTPAPDGEPKTAAAAQAAAQEAFDRGASGDYAGAWEMYTDQGRAAISQADYVRLNTACPGLQGVRISVVSARLEGDTAVVRIEVRGAVASYTMDYQGGRWLIEPTAQKLAEYRSGVTAAIAARKAAGTC